MNHELTGTPMAIDPSALPLSEALTNQGGPVRRIDQSQNRVVVIPVVGVLLPRVPFYAEAYGSATSTERLAAQVELVAESDPAGIVLAFDSPGGSVAGLPECAQRIAAVSGAVPVVAAASHNMLSGAYWIGCSCSAIMASPSAMVGSVGVIAVRESISRLLDKAGIDTDIAAEPEGKASVSPAAPLTEAAGEELMDLVGDAFSMFAAWVATRRTVSEATIRQWQARSMSAERARRTGMIDAVGGVPEAVQMLSAPDGRMAVARLAGMRAARRVAA